MAFNKIEYNNKYNKKSYERLNILVPKGLKEYIQKRAKETTGSINAYVNELIKIDLDSIDINKLEPNEQFILNLYRYGNKETQNIIFDAALKADSMLSDDDKKELFDKKINNIRNNNVINMNDNNGTINM